MSERAVLSVAGLSLEFPGCSDAVPALQELDLEVMPGEIVGIVGESGSGKSVASFSVMQLLRSTPHRITAGKISVLGRDMLAMPEAELQQMRGREISMIFQEPMTALNPVKRVGTVMIEVIRRHRSQTRSQARRTAAALLEELQMPDIERVLDSFPFELSGGMRQRVLIAMAFSCEPRLLIADEPTTALDVTVQAQILTLLRSMAAKKGTAVMFISHDLGVVASLCSRIYVMRSGRVVEGGDTAKVLERPSHPYTRNLLRALPEFATPRSRLPVDGAVNGAGRGANARLPVSAPARRLGAMLEVRDLAVDFPRWGSTGRCDREVARIIEGVSFSVPAGGTLGIIGESGSGKSTLARAVVGLVSPTGGRVLLDGEEIHGAAGWSKRPMRGSIQLVFQDPFSSLNPRMRVMDIIAEPVALVRTLTSSDRHARVLEAMSRVGLSEDHLGRFPHELSGGERQRVALARALSTRPRIVVLDEPTSALDVSIQARILNLLLELQQTLGLTYLFISHDVSVIRHMADEVAVMYRGRVVEYGPCASVLEQPRNPYTRSLIAAMPRVGPLISCNQATTVPARHAAQHADHPPDGETQA